MASGLREGRLSEGITQQQAARRCGISQPRWSELERGLGDTATIETWAIAASAVGLQLAAFLEGAPGADRPRDMEHLLRQNALVELAAPGGWRALPELAVDPSPRSRSIDVALVRFDGREAVAAEIWDWFDDVGAAFRSHDAKKLLLAERLEREHPAANRWRIDGLFVVRDTHRNRRLIHELESLFASRFGGRPTEWLASLARSDRRLPDSDGLLWSDSSRHLHGNRLLIR
jgi:transcriptional regulator with XRE-family HTH domain